MVKALTSKPLIDELQIDLTKFKALINLFNVSSKMVYSYLNALSSLNCEFHPKAKNLVQRFCDLAGSFFRSFLTKFFTAKKKFFP